MRVKLTADVIGAQLPGMKLNLRRVGHNCVWNSPANHVQPSVETQDAITQGSICASELCSERSSSNLWPRASHRKLRCPSPTSAFV